MSAFAGKLLQFSYSFSHLCLSPSEMTVGFTEPLYFEHDFAYWPYTLTHITVCFLKSVARWVDVYMSTFAGKLLQFSYSYVPRCLSPSEMTVGFNEPLHFEHNFACWPYTLTHTTVCFLKKVARWVDVYMSTSAGKLLQFSYSYVPGCLEGYSTTVCFYENLHLELSISLQVLHQVDQKAKVSFLEKMAIFIIDAIRIYLNYFPHTTLFM